MPTFAASTSLRIAVRMFATAAVATTAFVARADVKTTSKVVVTMDFGQTQSKVIPLTSYFKGGQVRVDQPDGKFTIIDSHTKRTLVFDTATKTYTQLTLDSMAGPAADVVKQIKMNMTGHLKPTTITKQIAGHLANEYLIDLSVDMTLPGINGGPSIGTLKGPAAGTFWTTSDLKEPYSPEDMVGALEPTIQAFAMFGNSSDLIKELSNFKGFPLSSTLTMTLKFTPSKDAPASLSGMPETLTLKMENQLLTLVETNVDAKLFEVPAGYKEVGGSAPSSPGAGQ